MRKVKFLISLVVFASDRVWSGLCRLLRCKRAPRCVVLYYHSVLDHQRDQFARQMDVLLQHARPVPVEGQVALRPGEHHVAVTFDDANANIITNALPTLAARKIPTTIFVISQRLGVIPDWENFGPDYTPEERTMTAAQLKALPAGAIGFGSHTMTHPILTKLDAARAKEELLQSRLQLEELLGQPVRTFSFPYGAYDERLIQLCREAGYERIFTTDPVLAFSQPHEFVVGRMAAEPTDGALEFRMKLAGAYRWVTAASSLKQRILRWLRPARA